MAIKMQCEKCGVVVLAFTKQPGDTIKCHACGNEQVIPGESLSQEQTGVIHTLKPHEIAAMKKHQARKNETGMNTAQLDALDEGEMDKYMQLKQAQEEEDEKEEQERRQALPPIEDILPPEDLED